MVGSPMGAWIALPFALKIVAGVALLAVLAGALVGMLQPPPPKD